MPYQDPQAFVAAHAETRSVLLLGLSVASLNEPVKVRRRDRYKKLDGKRILVIKDNPVLGKALTQLLREYDHASHVRSGIQVLQEINRQLPDVILLDVTLPDMSGLDIARAVRRTDKTRHIPILATSGSPLARLKCLAAGCNDFILEPFSMSKLLERLSLLLAH
jgi:CheY-like chemotaxis protein